MYDLVQVPDPSHPHSSSSSPSSSPLTFHTDHAMQAKFNRSRPESSVASREDKMKSPLGTQNLGQGTGPGSALGMAPGSGIFQVMEAAVLDLAAPWGKETFKVNLILYDKDRALCSALETAVWVRRDCYCYCYCYFCYNSYCSCYCYCYCLSFCYCCCYCHYCCCCCCS